MLRALKYFIIAICLCCPKYGLANEDGTRQVRSLDLVTDQGEALSMNAPNGKLGSITFVSHLDKWNISPKDINIRNGNLALYAFRLNYGQFSDKSGKQGIVTILSIPVVFSAKKNGHVSYDEGRLEINFYAGADALVDLWREQYSDRPIEHVSVKQVP